MKKTRSAWGFAGFYGFMWTKEKKLYGGEAEIRTPGALLTLTRFPIVLLQPARTPLRG